MKPLKRLDIELVKRILAIGPGALDTGKRRRRWERIKSHPEVLRIKAEVQAEIDDARALSRRRQFAVRREVSTMLPDAMKVLKKALKGPDYRTNPDGSVMYGSTGFPLIEIPEPTVAQRIASDRVFEILAVTESSDPRKVVGGAVSIRMDYSQNLEDLTYGDEAVTEADKLRSRDKQRRVVEALIEAQRRRKKQKALPGKVDNAA